MYELRHYAYPAGQDLLGQWLDGLSERQAQARVAAKETEVNTSAQHNDWFLEQRKAAGLKFGVSAP